MGKVDSACGRRFVVVSVVILFERGDRERRVVVREGARPGVAEL